ncbi:UDP-N-acetylmuramoyl-L-alanyl-D-glutamate--2,6-diaminopimelate ligase [Paenarthrobacter sp. DKR-5]|uniref:UDP-N-acetylmuramoyl-L-alanyl-D-glutamate--2, 6-diaminopimelate ligase n=1 Tax=Paenarthrobacter sp. DKR-5 TaxID=2835535 RepID=UPI0027DDC932|nr:UDP-N-acetylmuramoyl-L-alanyl-D-glutamate--2,6-diaminopimelate ligase [Paenarthrobacter sp. DKR-5]
MTEPITPVPDSEQPSGFQPSRLRPARVEPLGLAAVTEFLGLSGSVDVGVRVCGLSLNSRTVLPGDLYVALPGAARHGADFVPQAVAAGAVAVLTDPAGAARLSDAGVPVLAAHDPRALVGGLSGFIYRSQPAEGPRPALFGVTGTNGKTTTTYFINSLQRALGRTTGLIGTIEILAGSEPIPSLLTTPESTEVHGLLALMRERRIDGAAMEVSSHALAYHRVDGVRFDVVGFTNLTQDHLDLHGTMDDYFATKAQLFTAERAAAAVVTVDDEWGRRLAGLSGAPATTLATTADAGADADWRVTEREHEGLGTRFVLAHRDGTRLRLRTGLPGEFNVANAALAALMVLTSGVPLEQLQAAVDGQDPFTVQVPGRMQLVGTAPAAIVDFAHNPDALARALRAVRSPEQGAKVIVVFGATGQRDQTKRPTMGAIAAELADVVIITDDDPHDEDAAAIRADVLAGARRADAEGSLGRQILEVYPRADAIERAVSLASAADTILVAGRGHEVWQEVKGVNLALDDRVELRSALTAHGFSALPAERIES